MKVIDLFLMSKCKMVVVKDNSGLIIGILDGKNSISCLDIMNSSVVGIEVISHSMVIDTDFDTRKFLKDNFTKLNIEAVYKKWLLDEEKITSCKELINGITGEIFIQINDFIYDYGGLITLCINDEDFIEYIVDNWEKFELEWDL